MTEAERTILLARVVREARDSEVWRFTTPAGVMALWPALSVHLGRRRPFWEFLLGRWMELGLVSRGRESVVVDLVLERAPQMTAEKPLGDRSEWMRPRRSLPASSALYWAEPRSYLRGLIDRLARLAHPGAPV